MTVVRKTPGARGAVGYNAPMGPQPGIGRAVPRRVSTLVGHRQAGMALTCLGSLLAYAAEPLRLRIHDDGTLTAEDRERLGEGLGEPEFVSRREADERVAEALARFPAAAAFRGESPLGLKLFDVVLLAGGGELAYCDTDVLFLRPFSGLFDLQDGAGALFMEDRQNAYSLRSWHLLADRLAGSRLRLPRRANSGIIAFATGRFDFDLAEWFLSRPEYRFAAPWVEQTCWALLGGAAGCRLIDPRAVAIPLRAEIDPARVALHFVSPCRGLLAPIAALAPDRSREAPVAVRSAPAAACGFLDIARSEAGRLIRRLLPPHL
jgi:hypothetical protein